MTVAIKIIPIAMFAFAVGIFAVLVFAPSMNPALIKLRYVGWAAMAIGWACAIIGAWL